MARTRERWHSKTAVMPKHVKSGEIFENRQANFEKQSKVLEKLVANTQVLCEFRAPTYSI